MIDVYGQAVTDQLWDTPFTWGDVLKYDCASCYNGSGYAVLLLKGNQSDKFRGTFWGLQAFHNGFDYRGIEIPTHFLKEAVNANPDWAWTQAHQDYCKIPVNNRAYGMNYETMVPGTWHDYAFFRPALFVGGIIGPAGLIPAFASEAWNIVEELTDDILDIGHPLGDYHVAYPTIKVANRWGYLPTANTYSFFAPKSLYRQCAYLLML